MAAERIDLDGPQHRIEMAVHPEQVIALPTTFRANSATGDEWSDQCGAGDDDQHPFERL